MGSRRKKNLPAPAKEKALQKFDYEAALEAGSLGDLEIAAILDLLPETTNASEIAVRLNLPYKLVRKALDDPETVKLLVIRNFNEASVWYVTVALSKLRDIVQAAESQKTQLAALKLLGDVLAISERFARQRAPVGRPKTTVNVGVQVTPYEKLIHAADETGQPLLEADVLGDDDDGTETPG